MVRYKLQGELKSGEWQTITFAMPTIEDAEKEKAYYESQHDDSGCLFTGKFRIVKSETIETIIED